MGAGFGLLYQEIHYIKVCYIKVWAYHEIFSYLLGKRPYILKSKLWVAEIEEHWLGALPYIEYCGSSDSEGVVRLCFLGLQKQK